MSLFWSKGRKTRAPEAVRKSAYSNQGEYWGAKCQGKSHVNICSYGDESHINICSHGHKSHVNIC